MTRINCINVSELCNKHLFAEWKEIPRLISCIDKSLNRKSFNELMEIPLEYTLGKGHVKFFYNKLQYIIKRHKDLTNELLLREYNIEYRPLQFVNPLIPDYWFNDWIPDDKAKEINYARIIERLPKDAKYGKVKGAKNGS